MKITFTDRVISILAYFTFGMFSLIWIIFANLTKKRISPFLSFNLYQAIFISIVLFIVGYLYSIAINLISVIPFVGKLAHSFNLFFNETPLFLTFTISGFLVTLVVCYLSVLSLLGMRPYVPMISEIVKDNFGG
ncbi:MAG: hypothetical protein IKU37_08265 [Candidatus Gastranaerophilales bacterium]|nr:hypothetical protein [Candidatus Gastranaerophilales bacterium]